MYIYIYPDIYIHRGARLDLAALKVLIRKYSIGCISLPVGNLTSLQCPLRSRRIAEARVRLNHRSARWRPQRPARDARRLLSGGTAYPAGAHSLAAAPNLVETRMDLIGL